MGVWGNPETRFRSGKEQVEISRRGGKAGKGSPVKSRASKISYLKRAFKKGTLSNSKLQQLLMAIENKEVMDLQLLEYYDEIKDTVHPSQRVALLNTGNALRKSIHGDSSKTQINVQVNILDEEKVKSTINRLLVEDDEEDDK